MLKDNCFYFEIKEGNFEIPYESRLSSVYVCVRVCTRTWKSDKWAR